MDPRRNPYAPGAGLQPPELAGRDALLEDASIAMDRMLGRLPVRGMFLLGLRGVGKTVLLNRLHRMADEKGIQTGKVEAPENGRLPQLLAPELRRILARIDLLEATGQTVRRAWGAIRNFCSAFRVSAGEFEFGIDPERGLADTGVLQQDLPDMLIAVAEAAAAHNSAVGLFIDEVQYLSTEELAALIVSCHEAAQRGLPFLLIGAGLPQIAALAGNAKSYSERLFSYPEVGPLHPDAARAALERPAESHGVAFSPDAVEAVLGLTERYPYFIQEWGYHLWNAAEGSPVGREVVEGTVARVTGHLDNNFFRVRFERLTPLQQKYLRAMAELGPGPHQTGLIAGALGVEPRQVATVRQQLINKGMIWSQRHGETAFTVPQFDRFMRRQMPTLEPHVPRRRT